MLPIIPLELRVNGSMLRLLNTITTSGTLQDLGLQELRIEMSYPMDSQTPARVERQPATQGTPTVLHGLQNSS